MDLFTSPLLLTQDDRSLKDQTSELLDLAYQTHYPDIALHFPLLKWFKSLHHTTCSPAY